MPADLPVRIALEHSSFPSGQIDLASDPQTGGQLPTDIIAGAGFVWAVSTAIDGTVLQLDDVDGDTMSYTLR